MDEQACNPFSTRFTRPGALPFYFDEGDDAGELVARLRQHNWFGQIIGPHGSGKSTLLATLRPVLEAAGREVRLVQLPAEPATKFSLPSRRQLSAATQLVIDGYEQLSPLTRWLIVRRCRWRGCGLLITAHRDSGLPTLYTMQPGLELALSLARRLLPAADAIGRADIEAAWQAHRGNLREVLFSLYDLFEQRRPAGG